MSPSSPPPGPDADATFTLGLVVSLVLSGLAVGVWLWSGSVTLVGAAVLVVLGLPTVFVVASCLLAVWLGYNKDAMDAFRLTDALGEHAEE